VQDRRTRQRRYRRPHPGRPTSSINHTGRPFDEEVFGAILDAAPAAISFRMGVPADRIAEAHEVGAL
jgi:nitronate monooxygenase/enoyl-[acyl-carrier protein] reductase II